MEEIVMPKHKEYRVRFATGFVVEALDENDAEQKATDMLFETVEKMGADGFNIDIDEI